MSYGHLHLQLLKWQYISARALQEAQDSLKSSTATPPHFCDRLADDYAEADNMAEFGLKIGGKL